MITKSTPSGISWSEFAIFSRLPLKHAFFHRSGGVSTHPWNSLNFGGGLGDLPEHTIDNKKRALSALDIDPGQTFDVWQVHSTDIVEATHTRMDGEPYIKADGMITDHTDLALVMRFADCVPLLVYDPIRHVIGIAHAGWKGTVNKIANRLIESMQQRFGSKPQDLLAGIGPSICSQHYPVGDEVVAEVKTSLPPHDLDLVIRYEEDIPHLDLWKMNEILFEKSGVKQIEVGQECTACDTGRWYSHRAEHGKTGRFGAVVQLG